MGEAPYLSAADLPLNLMCLVRLAACSTRVWNSTGPRAQSVLTTKGGTSPPGLMCAMVVNTHLFGSPRTWQHHTDGQAVRERRVTHHVA